MPTPPNQELVQYLINSSEFKRYMEWVVELMEELNSVVDMDGMDRDQAGDEALARAKAFKKLNESLAPFIEYRSKREPSVAEVQKAKENYGL